MTPKTAFLFPGQGTQKPGMGSYLVERYPHVVKPLFEEADEILGFPLSHYCAEGPADRLREMPITQPAVFLISHATACALVYEGVRADLVAGHSLGEYAALTHANVLDWRDTLRLVQYRGVLMGGVHARTDGKMAAIIGPSVEEVERVCADVAAETGMVIELANHNEPTQTVVSGQSSAVDRLAERVMAEGAERVSVLRIGGPAHSSLMEEVTAPFSEFLATLEFRDPTIELVSSATAGCPGTADDVRRTLGRQLVHRVKWVDTMNALNARGARVAVEVGPGKVLSGLISRNQPSTRVFRTNDEANFATTVVALAADEHEPKDMRELVRDLRERRAQACAGPDPHATVRQHDRGKQTARERVEELFDEGTFVELDQLRRHRSYSFGLEHDRPYSDGVVAGWGKVHGRTTFCYAHDFRIFGGSLGEEHAKKIHKVMDLALNARRPLVALNDGAGARIQEGVVALAGYGGIFSRNVKASGVIPQISVMLGPCAGGAAYSPGLTDFVFMVERTSQMFVTGPDVVRAVTGEDVSLEELGGAGVHARRSGVCHARYNDETSCLEDVRFLLSLLPAHNRDSPPRCNGTDDPARLVPELAGIVPASPMRGYDIRDVIRVIVDDGEDFEIHAEWAKNIVCTMVRLGGHVVGIVANQPCVSAGALDIDASEKAARFVQMCDAFNIPLVTLVDVPGFLPGVDQEHEGIIRHGAKLLYAYCDATVPRISVILRKAYGGAYIVMDSRSIGADVALAWPTNEVAVMGAAGAANVLFRREIAGARHPELERRLRMRAYREEFMSPYYAVERGLVDDVIDPADTRRILVEALDMLRNKDAVLSDRKHGNPPY